MRETWYVLEDGSTVHPSEVAPNAKGRLAHKNGLVKMRDADTPMSSGVDVDDRTGKRLFAGKGDHDASGKIGGSASPAAQGTTAAPPTADPPNSRDMEPERAKPAAPKKPYKTR